MKHARKRRTRPIGYTQPVGGGNGEEEGREDKKGKETHENKLPTAKLLACIHGMQKGDGGEGGTREGGKW